MISLSVIVGDVAGAIDLTSDQAEALATGGLPGDDVWYEYVTQHDSHVRPSHAALDGTTWKVGDPFAPVPPTDWGCRCAMSYCGRPGSVAARVLPEAKNAPTTRAAAYAAHLDREVPEWRTIAEETAKLGLADRTGAIVLRLKSMNAADARDVAMMIIEASKKE